MAEIVSDLFSKANSAFVDENYAEALNLYNKVLEQDPTNGQAYLKRSHAQFKLGKWEATIQDVDKALEHGCKNAKALFRKGQAAFNLKEYKQAKEALEEASKLDSQDNDLVGWIEKCASKLKIAQDSAEKSQTELAPPAVPGKIRHDWYQTESHVVITILLKNQKPEDIETKFTKNAIWFKAKLLSGDDYELAVDLAHPVIAEQTTYKCYSTKVEIRAKKEEGIRWTKLEFDSSTPAQPCPMMFSVPEASVVEKPAPIFKAKDWDNIVKETDADKPEGDAALNALFQKIYADGSDDVRRAMNKSFIESGGTVLSTNWEEISKQTTPVKPPDGMEYRKWQ